MVPPSRGSQSWDVTAEEMGPGEEVTLCAEAQSKPEEGQRGQAQPSSVLQALDPQAVSSSEPTHLRGMRTRTSSGFYNCAS